MIEQHATNLKKLLDKTGYDDDKIIEGAIKGLDALCDQFLNSPVCRRNLVIPSVVSGVHEWCEEPKPQVSVNWFVKTMTHKALNGSVKTVVSLSGKSVNNVRALIKRASQEWLKKVYEENNLRYG